MTDGMRARRIFLLAFFAYVFLDLGCPMIPGAFSFDAADSVDAVSAYRLRPAALPRIVVAPPSTARTDLLGNAPRLVGVSPLSREPVDWRPHAGRDRTSPSKPLPSLDDD